MADERCFVGDGTASNVERAGEAAYEVRGTSGEWRLIEVATGAVLRRSQYRHDLLDNHPNTVLVDEGADDA